MDPAEKNRSSFESGLADEGDDNGDQADEYDDEDEEIVRPTRLPSFAALRIMELEAALTVPRLS